METNSLFFALLNLKKRIKRRGKKERRKRKKGRREELGDALRARIGWEPATEIITFQQQSFTSQWWEMYKINRKASSPLASKRASE